LFLIRFTSPPSGVVFGIEVATFSGVVSGTKIYKQISILQNTMTTYVIELYDDANLTKFYKQISKSCHFNAKNYPRRWFNFRTKKYS
jgi:hypothetical protein